MQKKHDECEDMYLKIDYKNNFILFNHFLRLILFDWHSLFISSGNSASYNWIKVSNEHMAPSHPEEYLWNSKKNFFYLIWFLPGNI